MATDDDDPLEEIQSCPEESNSPSILSEGINTLAESDVIFECTVPAKVPKICGHGEDSEQQNTVTIFNKLLHNAANNLHATKEYTEGTVEQVDYIKGKELRTLDHGSDCRGQIILSKEDSIQVRKLNTSEEGNKEGETIQVSFQGKQPKNQKQNSFQEEPAQISEQKQDQTKKDNNIKISDTSNITGKNILKNCTENINNPIDTELSLIDSAVEKDPIQTTEQQILSDNFTFNFPPLTPPQITPLSEESLSLHSSLLLPAMEQCHKAVQTISSGEISTSTIYTGDLVTEDE